MRKTGILLIIIVFVAIIISCDSNRVFQEYKSIDNNVWQHDDIISFDFDIEDTVSLHNLFINIRHTTNYPFNNMWLFVTSTSPEGLYVVDTVQCIFADKSGKWLGDGSGSLWDNKILWKQLVRFPNAGTYSVKYQHGMRLKSLPGVVDVGFRIEKFDK